MNRQAHDWQGRAGKVIMTDIDPGADIQVSHQGDHVIAMLPLDSPVTQEWHHRYDTLAQAQGVPARIMQRERAWIVVTLPIDAERTGIETTLNAARQLIAKIRADDQSAAEAEALVREWWAHQRP